MSTHISLPKWKAFVYSFFIACIVGFLIVLFHIIIGISFDNIYSWIITGFSMGLAITLTSRIFYYKNK